MSPFLRSCKTSKSHLKWKINQSAAVSGAGEELTGKGPAGVFRADGNSLHHDRHTGITGTSLGQIPQ